MDIDTRTDVYALGVMLYELLAGSPPMEAKDFKRGAVLEMLRMVREVEPPRPSTKLSTAEGLPNIAANRSIEPARLSKLLQGELDWVVMKALEKDRNRRYETANGFARDIQRYLADEVVEARPPSRGYRLKKFVKRNKIQVIAASLVLFALLAGDRPGRPSGDSWPRSAGKRPSGTWRSPRRGMRSWARCSPVWTRRRMAESGRPLQDVLRENLVKAVKELEGSAIGDPLEVAAMQNTLGTSLLGLGEYRPGGGGVREGPGHAEGQARPRPPRHPRQHEQPGDGYREAGKLDKALPLFEETLALMKAKLGPDHPDTLMSMNNLARATWTPGSWTRPCRFSRRR